MSTQAANYRELITQLPPGSRLSLYDVAWDEYDDLVQQLDDVGFQDQLRQWKDADHEPLCQA